MKTNILRFTVFSYSLLSSFIVVVPPVLLYKDDAIAIYTILFVFYVLDISSFLKLSHFIENVFYILLS